MRIFEKNCVCCLARAWDCNFACASRFDDDEFFFSAKRGDNNKKKIDNGLLSVSDFVLSAPAMLANFKICMRIIFTHPCYACERTEF